METPEQPKYTIDQLRSAIFAQWKKDFGKMRDDTAERDGYFVLGFVLAALENYDMQEKIPQTSCLHVGSGLHDLDAPIPLKRKLRDSPHQIIDNIESYTTTNSTSDRSHLKWRE